MTQTDDLLDVIPNQRPVLAPAAGVTVAGFLAAHAAEACVWLAIWQYAGGASLSARFDSSWIWRWTLLLASLVPLRFWSTWSQGRLAILVGGLWKHRLPADKGTREDAELALSGGLASLVSVVELALASAVLTLSASRSASGGASGGILLAVFLAWALLAIAVAWRYSRARHGWSISHYPAVHDDYRLSPYRGTSARMERWAVRLNSSGANGWVLIGVLGLVPAFYGGASPTDLAVGLGGMLLAYQALRSALSGVSNLIGAAVSWCEADPLFSADAVQPAAVADTIGARRWRNENRSVTGTLAFKPAERAHLASHV
jgi:ATP-binding cassette, subfamily B, bacterial